MSLLFRCTDQHHPGMRNGPPQFWRGTGSRWLLWNTLVMAFLVGFAASDAAAQNYDIRFVATGLSQPTGLTASALGDSDTLYFTELPQAAQGLGVTGANTVSQLTISTGAVTVLNRGDPQPTNIVQDKQGNLYWTSRAPGVILMQAPMTQTPSCNTTILVWGLQQPVGIALDATGQNLYFTEVPTYGVPGANGGENKVSSVNLANGARTILTTLDPAPTDIVVASNGDTYFTCKSAGVIVHQDGVTLKQSFVLTGLQQPTGIALDPTGQYLYFTEVPTPGVSSDDGGQNGIYRYDLQGKAMSLVHFGDPYPNSLAVTPNGNIYWTCTSAGVIREAQLTP